MIEAVEINKSFDGNQILEDVSATFKTGQTNLIIGQSGSGKTVFLKTLVGLHRVTFFAMSPIRALIQKPPSSLTN
jgi:phospholipid/cholesterol/gamma-HCH transport system ATP-binding protein